MKSGAARFNCYLLVMTLVAGTGCRSGPAKSPRGQGKKDEASLRLHLEVNADGTDRNGPLTVGRAVPFVVNVEKNAFLTEFQVEKASVVEVLGGFAIALQFNPQGTWLLEQYSGIHKGKRFAIVGEWGECRTLAAPQVRDRITNGLFVFTPDGTREEVERIVEGVNKVADRVRSGQK